MLDNAGLTGYYVYMRPVILYRESRETMHWDELTSARKYFECFDTRMLIQEGDLVIGRYSVLPFYREQERDINIVGAKLINSYQQHLYIADLKNWVSDLKGLTPETWDRLENLPDDCSFVLKGETNSRKHLWSDMMFAKDKKAAGEVHSRLCKDGLVGGQDIYIRKYYPLKTYMIGIKDLPITHEFRFFICYGQILCGGYYWTSHVDDLPFKPDPNDVPREFLQKVINKIGNNANFYVIDVALTVEGEWIVIELNDGQMSGIQENIPDDLYCNLQKAVNLCAG